jgi:outer membrane lipoprotein-sorting protein
LSLTDKQPVGRFSGDYSFLLQGLNQEKVTAKTILTQLTLAADALGTASFDLKIAERCNGKMRNSSSHVKLQRSPQKIYMKLNGPELLYVKGANDNKVLVNPAGFPYVDINLDINSATLHKDQHHTISEVGFDFLNEIIKDAVARTGPKFEEYFKYDGVELWNAIPCYKVTITDASYKFTTYSAAKGESLISIARKLKLSEYKLGELNSMTDYDTPFKAGKVLIVPTSYARITELLVDQKSWLPLCTKVYDNTGLFETYEYVNLRINPVFATDEFTRNFKGYGF